MEQVRSLTKKRNAVGTVTTVGMSANWSQLDSDPQENIQVKSLLDIDISPLRGGLPLRTVSRCDKTGLPCK